MAKRMKEDPMETELPTQHMHIGVRVFVYGTLCTLMVAIVMMAGMGYLAWSSMREVADLRDALHLASDSQQTCRIALERMDAKLELADQWVFNARKMRSTASGGSQWTNKHH